MAFFTGWFDLRPKGRTFISIINEKHLSSGCIIMTVLWPITRSDRTETLIGQSTSTSLGVQNKDTVAVSQTDYTGFSSDAAQAKK